MSCLNQTLQKIESGLIDPCQMTYREIIAAYMCADERSMRILDRILADCCCSAAIQSVAYQSAVSNDGDQEITIVLSAAQIAAGFTTDHIRGRDFTGLNSTKEIWVTDAVNATKTASQITYRLSGVEDTDAGHTLTVIMIK